MHVDIRPEIISPHPNEQMAFKTLTKNRLHVVRGNESLILLSHQNVMTISQRAPLGIVLSSVN